MIKITDQILLSLGLPLDPRLSNVILSGNSILIETNAEYLIRVTDGERYLGMDVNFVGPDGIYEVNDFINRLINGQLILYRYTFETNTSNAGLILKPSGGGGDTVIVEDISVFGVGEVGGYTDGDTVLTGTSLTNFAKTLLQKLEDLVQPEAFLESSPNGNQEIGATLNYILTPSFIQNDSGDLNLVVFKRDTTIIRSHGKLSSYTDTNQIVQLGTNPYSIEISYDEGLADPQKDGFIPAGTVINNISITGLYKNWFGSYENTPPVTGGDIRTLLYSYEDTFIINTGSTDLIHTVSVPNTKTLISVIDEDGGFVNITSSYILSTTLTTVPDGGGNNIDYNVYILTLSIPYSTNHKHNIIIG